MKRHRKLKSWQGARRLVSRIYEVTENFPEDERFELTSQLRRAAISVPSNIAEGAARASTADYIRFLYQARGSISEIDTQLVLAADLDYLDDDTTDDLVSSLDDLAAILQAQINSLEAKQ